MKKPYQIIEFIPFLKAHLINASGLGDNGFSTEYPISYVDDLAVLLWVWCKDEEQAGVGPTVYNKLRNVPVGPTRFVGMQ